MVFNTARTFVFIAAALSLASLPSASAFYKAPTGPFATHYHDCCRPAFSYDHPKAHTYAPVDTCEKDGLTLIPASAQMSGKNGCDGGNQFACTCTMTPWVDSVDPELGYAFGAYNVDIDGSIESACYLNEFKPQDPTGKEMKVKKLIIQNINTSQGIPKGSWDLAFAAGGVGDYNKGCTNQWGDNFGARFGGVDNEQACCSLHESLRASCLFRFTLFGNNPELASTPQRVRCPKGLIDRSGSQRKDDVSAPVYSGKTDQTGQPAPDQYQRNRSVCQNLDPLGIVSSVCGGSGGARMPKGSGMMRQDHPAGAVPGGQGQPEGYGPGLGQAGAGTGATQPIGSAPPAAQPGAGGSGSPSGQPPTTNPAGLPVGQKPGGQQAAGAGLPSTPGSGSPNGAPEGYAPEGYGKTPVQGLPSVAGDSISPDAPTDPVDSSQGVCSPKGKHHKGKHHKGKH